MSPPPSPPPPSLPCSWSDTPNAFPFADNYGIGTDCASALHEFSKDPGSGDEGAGELAALCAKTVLEAGEAFELAGISDTTNVDALDTSTAKPKNRTYTWQPPLDFDMSDRIVDICPDTCATFGVYVSGCSPPALPPSPTGPPPPSPPIPYSQPPPSTPPPPPPPSPTSPPPKSRPPSPSIPAEGPAVVVFSITVAGTVGDFDAESYKSNLAAVLAVEKDKVTLVVAAASVRVTAEVLVAEASVAMAALRALACDQQQDGGVCDAASMALGVTVEAVDEPYVTKRQHVGPPPPSPPSADSTDSLGDKQVTNGKLADEVTIAIAVGAAALLGCACAMACLWKKCRQARESPIDALKHGDSGKAPTNIGVALHNSSELSGARAPAMMQGSPVYFAQKWLANKVAEDVDEVPCV